MAFLPLREEDGWNRGQSGQLLTAFSSPLAHNTFLNTRWSPPPNRSSSPSLRDLSGYWEPFLHPLNSFIFKSQVIS